MVTEEVYKEHISKLSGQWPGITYLDYFLKSPDYQDNDVPNITLVGVSPGHQENSNLTRAGFDPLYALCTKSHRLIIVVNPRPSDIVNLGSRFDVDVQFWADLLVGPAWFDNGTVSPGPTEAQHTSFVPFRDDNAYDQLWPLPSDAKRQRHKCFRMVTLKELNDTNSYLNKLYPLNTKARDCAPLGAHAASTRNIVALWTNGKQSPTVEAPWVGKYARTRASAWNFHI